MGRFLDLWTDGRSWHEGEPTREPWLRVSVHDSDVGAMEYAPRFGGSGVAYAGYAARTYFEDESIPATDKSVEVEALRAWFSAAGVMGSDLREGLESLLVGEGEEADEPFVEEALAAFFEGTSLGFPDGVDG